MSPILPGDPKEVGRLMALASVGAEMVAPIVMGLLLDKYLGWQPWGVVAGAVLGCVGGILHLAMLGNIQERRRQQEAKKPSSEDL